MPDFLHILGSATAQGTHSGHARAMQPEQIPNRVQRRPDLLAAGITEDDIQRRRRLGNLVSVRAGRYVAPADLARLDAAQRHRLLTMTAAPDLPDDAAFSHASAACLLGLPTWNLDMRTVQVTRPGTGGGHRRRSLHTRFARLEPDEVTVMHGVRVTTAARTIVDLGRSVPFESAVVCADAALRAGLVTLDLLHTASARATGIPRVGRARRVIAFADARSESVGESRSRVAIARAGLPKPDLQVEVCAPDGTLVGRTDFGWREHRTLGVLDGVVKYGRLLRPGQHPGDAVFEEKCREDRLRDEGRAVVRWIWPELDARGSAVARIGRALGRPDARR